MIDQLWEYLVLAGVALVALVGLMVGLLRGSGRRRRTESPGTRPPVERPRGTKDYQKGTIKLDRRSDHAPAASSAATPSSPSTRPSGGGGASAQPRPQPADASTPAQVVPAPAAASGEEVDGSRPQDTSDFTPTIEDRSRPLETPAPSMLPPQEVVAEPAEAVEVAPLAVEDAETQAPAGPVEPATTGSRPSQDEPTDPADRMHQLRSRLARSNSAIGKSLLSLLAAGDLSEEDWEDVEDTLLRSDLGIEATTELVDKLRHHVSVDGATDLETARDWLYADMLELVDPTLERGLAAGRVGDRPACMLVVGVNGTGKTTTVGKLARVLVANDLDVVLGAADTFRAAAADQLETWGARVGVATVRSDRDGADPAAVAFDAVRVGYEMEADTVLIDTAGRLHNKVGLMDELAKIKRVIEKRSPIDEVLLVIDATTGQNGLKQAEVFSQVVDVTGIVLTKLDGTAKGGIVVAVQRQLGVPVKLVGLGEGPDDLAPFDPEVFVDAIVGG